MTDLASTETAQFLSSIAGLYYGIIGGVIAELIGWYKLRNTLHNSCPAFAKSIVYWFLTILMIFAGGGLVYVYIESGIQFKAILAINIGATAPLILEALTRYTPTITPGTSD